MAVISEYLKKVQAYPEERRRRLLLVSTTGLTTVIILLWLLNLWWLAGASATDKESSFNFINTVEKEWDRLRLGFVWLITTASNLIK